jgi:hypothetical protein
MTELLRIGDGAAPAPPPRERRNRPLRDHNFDHAAAGAELIASVSSHEPGRDRWTELKVWYCRTPPSKGRPWLAESIGRSVVPGETDRIRRLNVGSLERALKLFTDSDLGVIVSELAREWAETSPPSIDPARLETAKKSADRLGLSDVVRDFGVRRAGQLVVSYGGGLRAGKSDALHFSPSIDPEFVAELKAETLVDGKWRDLPPMPDLIADELAHPQPVPETDEAALAWLYGETDRGKATFATMFARDFDMPARTVTAALKDGTGIRVPLRSILRFVDRAAFRAWRKGEKGEES